MSVTAEIIRNHQIYGASDNTAPAGIVSSRALNYAAGPSITRPDEIPITLIPYTLKYQGAVGLFGAENYFVKVKVNVDREYVDACFEETYWECAQINDFVDTDPFYNEAVIDRDADLTTINTYEPAEISERLLKRFKAYVSIDLNNLKTGNIYVDSWLDVRLYTASREEHPYDVMYVRENDVFYIGFHARNTRRLAYNVNCVIGSNYISDTEMTSEQRKLIARR
jgi:hypothetical protein